MRDMKKVLLTGATGFIGSHCVKPLLDLGYEVHAVCRTPIESQFKNLYYHPADLLDQAQQEKLLSQVKPSHLLHTAWLVEPGVALSSPENALWVERSLGLLRQFKRCGGTNVVVTGTCYEYDTNYGYLVEDQTPLNPSTYYGVGKNALRMIGQIDAVGSEIVFAWARLFYLYGPRENPRRLVPYVINSLLNNEVAECSHGSQVRDYIYVQDAADGLVTLLDRNVSGAYNICSGQAVSLKDIILRINQKIGGKGMVRFGARDARSEEVPLIIGDTRKFALHTGWASKQNLDSGLELTIEWWRGQSHKEKGSQ